jgi:hypothetical protein
MKTFVLLAFTLVACAPTEQDCRALMPIAGDAVTISTTPSGMTGCTTNVDGVTVTTELHRDGLHWRAGQTWVDERATPAGEVHAAIAAIKARREVGARIAAGTSAADALVKKGKENARQLWDRLRKR